MAPPSTCTSPGTRNVSRLCIYQSNQVRPRRRSKAICQSVLTNQCFTCSFTADLNGARFSTVGGGVPSHQVGSRDKAAGRGGGERWCFSGPQVRLSWCWCSQPGRCTPITAELVQARPDGGFALRRCVLAVDQTDGVFTVTVSLEAIFSGNAASLSSAPTISLSRSRSWRAVAKPALSRVSIILP